MKTFGILSLRVVFLFSLFLFLITIILSVFFSVLGKVLLLKCNICGFFFYDDAKEIMSRLCALFCKLNYRYVNHVLSFA